MKNRQRKIRSSPFSSLSADVLPFELPIAFDTSDLRQFLQTIEFKWEADNKFRVRSDLEKGEVEQLRILFALNLRKTELKPNKEDSRYCTIDLLSMSESGFAPKPLRYGVSTGSGKSRILSLIHPRMMIELAYLFDEYAEIILYYCNRSKFSLRHPVSKTKRVSIVDEPILGSKTELSDNFLSKIRRDGYIPSIFKYERFQNISTFYDSADFRACERKYTHLVKADISKCFDSIYTHSISWAIHGITASKKMVGKVGEKSIGGKLDKYFQRSNYNETNGICIGPETSRIFAEIILQEVDVLTAQELEQSPISLVWGRDYEVFRYVDDYFIFASSEKIATKVLTTLKTHLAEYKLHINEAKTGSLELPLLSGLSIAKNLVREVLIQTGMNLKPKDAQGELELSWSAATIVRLFKRILLETGELFESLASYFLHCLEQQAQETSAEILRSFGVLKNDGNENQIKEVRKITVKYFLEVLDTALFVYSGFPSPNQSIKLSRIIINASNIFNLLGISSLDRASFLDKVRRELTAQLNSIRDVSSFGIHTLNLIDTLTYLGISLTPDELADVIELRGQKVGQLDAIALMVLLRACMETSYENGLRIELLQQIEEIVADPLRETEAAILKLSIPWCPFLEDFEIIRATRISENQLKNILSSTSSSLFNWEVDSEYYGRLLLKSSLLVY